MQIDAARRIGGLAPDYFLYWEEVDWCVRAQRAGYRLLVEPRASVIHRRSTRIPSLQVRMLNLRNAILFMRRNGTVAQNLTSLGWAVCYRSPALIARCLKRPADLLRAPYAIAEAFGWNILDAARRRRWRVRSEGPAIPDGVPLDGRWSGETPPAYRR